MQLKKLSKRRTKAEKERKLEYAHHRLFKTQVTQPKDEPFHFKVKFNRIG